MRLRVLVRSCRLSYRGFVQELTVCAHKVQVQIVSCNFSFPVLQLVHGPLIEEQRSSPYAKKTSFSASFAEGLKSL